MSKKRNDRGLAFPNSKISQYIISTSDEQSVVKPVFEITGGMSLRDYFAGKALAGIIFADCSHTMAAQPRAELAYRIADAMLEEREKS